MSQDETGNLHTFPVGGSQFTFQAVGIGDLGADEYTLVTIVLDTTGSVHRFSDQLRNMLVTAVTACCTSDRKDYLLVRVVLFSTSYPNGHRELHGFKPVLDINPDTSYPTLNPGGGTPLWDATYAGIGAMVEYGTRLQDNDYARNGILFVITDGMESQGASVSTPAMIKNKMYEAIADEHLESLVSILVAINAANCAAELQAFHSAAGFTHYIDAGDATANSLARLAAFIAQSISSQSQALGTGGPSQSIAPTI